MESWDAAQERTAKALFGRPLRLKLAAWILTEAKTTVFGQQDALDGVRAVSRSATSVPKELGTFVDAGMLQRIDGSQRVYYQVLASPLWAAFAEVLIAVGVTRREDIRLSESELDPRGVE